MTSLNIKKFNINKIKANTTLIISKRCSGGTTLTKNIINNEFHKNILNKTIMCTSVHCFNEYKELNNIDETHMYEGYSSHFISKFVNNQKKNIIKYNKEIIKYNTSNINPNGFIIFDDVLYYNTWYKDNNIILLFINGFHYKTSLIITLQYSFNLPLIIHNNIDFIFIFKNHSLIQRERIYKQYASNFFNTFEMFSQVMNQYTQNYCCLVIDNTVASDKIEDCIFWYRADYLY